MSRPRWSLPGLGDPRWAILAFLVSYDLYAIATPEFGRRPAQWAAGIGACLLSDLAFLRLRKVSLVPLSGLISSLGLLLLLDSPFVWPYALCGFLAIASKHLIRVDGRHVFNPLNFGCMTVLLLLPGWTTMDAGRWGNTSPLLITLVALGFLAAWRAKRLLVATAYLAVFFAGAWLRSQVWGAPMGTICAPATGAAFHLFAFYMITDPATTPDRPTAGLAFGGAVGLLDAALRQVEYRYAPLLALFLLCTAVPFWRRRSGQAPAHL